jgi:hypothetical protein
MYEDTLFSISSLVAASTDTREAVFALADLARRLARELAEAEVTK